MEPDQAHCLVVSDAASPDGFWALASELFAVVGADGTLHTLNPAWERVLGRSRDDMLGHPVTEFLHPDDVKSATDELERAHSAGSALERFENRWRRGDGSFCRLSWRGSFDGETWFVAGHDVTSDEEQQRLLRDAHRLARLTHWEWAIADDHVMTVDGTQLLAGTPGRTPADLATLLAHVPSEERVEVSAGFAALRAGERESVSIEHRLIGASGEVRWLETHARLVREPTGRPAVVRGTSQDITDRVNARQSLLAASELWQGTMDSLEEQVAVIDDIGEIIAVNAAWRQFGPRCDPPCAESGLVGTNYLAVCDDAVDDPTATRCAAGIRALFEGRRHAFTLLYPCPSRTAERWYVLRATRFSGTGPVRVVIAHRDITERRTMEARTRIQAKLLDEIDVGVVATDTSGTVTHWNHGAEAQFGWSQAEALGVRASDLVVAEPVTVPGRGPPERDGRRNGRFSAHRRDGSTFAAYIRDTALLDDAGRPTGTIGVSLDITDEVAAQESLAAARNHLSAVTDSMGEGLFALDCRGRVTLMNRAAEQMLGWSAAQMHGRVMHDFVHLRRSDGTPYAPETSPILRTLRDGRAVRVDDESFVRQDGTELQTSYTATPLITGDGHDGCVVVFADDTARRASERDLHRRLDALHWIGRLQDALRDERFVLYGQPILDLRTDEVVQQELLLRVREADGEIVAPARYLQIAEEHGLIGEIDRWVIGQAVGRAAYGEAVELNISASSINDPTLMAHIEACLDTLGADPRLLVFEITESALMSDGPGTLQFAERLRELGCKLALDDFGTGYGGLKQLKQLPVDFLKIDIEFVRDLRTSVGSRNVVEAVVRLAQSFGLQTVAEGVEDAETLIQLKALGVDFAQGFHIARPHPLEARM